MRKTTQAGLFEVEEIMEVSYKPAGKQCVIPYPMVPNAEKELAFVNQLFAASEAHVSRDRSGRIAHAELAIGESVVMMAQPNEQWPLLPAAIYVPDVDAAYKARSRRRRPYRWREEL
jgi:hypothetical protein